MANTKIQHPTLERVVYDVPTDTVSDWEEAGWKVLGDSESSADAPDPAASAESEEPAAEVVAASADAPAVVDSGEAATPPSEVETAPADTRPFTDTQGSDSPPATPATGGSTKTTRKAV